MQDSRTTVVCTAFEGYQRIASGDLRLVARMAKEVIDRGAIAPVLIFDNVTSEPIEVDFRGTIEEVAARLPESAEAPTEGLEPECKGSTPRGPGRPRLGVVGHEVTLLPRHWDWLNSQPGGASVALRKLVEQARRASEQADRIRLAQEAAYRFMAALAGNLPGFEEACRALFARDRQRFIDETSGWPADVRDFATTLAASAFDTQAP